MSEAIPAADITLDEMTYVPKNSNNEIEKSRVPLTILDDLDKMPKTIDQLMSEMRGEEPEQQQVINEKKPSQKDVAVGVQQQFQALLKEKEDREISSGMIGTLMICAFGIFAAIAMAVSGHFAIIHCVLVMIFSVLFVVKSKPIKSLSYLVFPANAIYLTVILVKHIIGKQDSTYLLGIILIAVAIVANLVICGILMKNDNINKYYDTAKKN